MRRREAPRSCSSERRITAPSGTHSLSCSTRRAGTTARDPHIPLALSLLVSRTDCAEIFSGRLLLDCPHVPGEVRARKVGPSRIAPHARRYVIEQPLEAPSVRRRYTTVDGHSTCIAQWARTGSERRAVADRWRGCWPAGCRKQRGREMPARIRPGCAQEPQNSERTEWQLRTAGTSQRGGRGGGSTGAPPRGCSAHGCAISTPRAADCHTGARATLKPEAWAAETLPNQAPECIVIAPHTSRGKLTYYW